MKRIKRITDILATLSRTKSYIYYDFEKITSNNLEELEQIPFPFLEYIPVKIIAFFEEYFRQIYSLIINSEEFRSNVINYFQSDKITLDVKSIYEVLDNKTLTIGDYLSYSISCSSYNDINNALSRMLGIDFNSKIQHIYELEKQSGSNSKINYNKVIRDLSSLFSLRHQICHECATSLEFNAPTAFDLIESAKTFYTLTNTLAVQLIPGYMNQTNMPTTQTEMSQYAGSQFEKREAELSQLILTLKNKSKYSMDTDDVFDDSFLPAWQEYRKQRAESEAKTYEGGSMYVLIVTMAMEDITKELIDNLKTRYRALLNRKDTNLGDAPEAPELS